MTARLEASQLIVDSVREFVKRELELESEE
jgi:hypothetical protein